jgi:hypothetical protein
VLAGDSAGSGLAMALLAELRRLANSCAPVAGRTDRPDKRRPKKDKKKAKKRINPPAGLLTRRVFLDFVLVYWCCHENTGLINDLSPR